MLIPRIIEKDLKNRLDRESGPNKVIIIFGARQVGKTTLVKQLAQTTSKRTEYFNCDYLDIQSMFSWENAGKSKPRERMFMKIMTDTEMFDIVFRILSRTFILRY